MYVPRYVRSCQVSDAWLSSNGEISLVDLVIAKVQHDVLQYPLRKLHGVNYPRSFVLSFAIREAFFTTVPLQLADTDAGLRNTPGQATSASASSF